MEIFQINDIKLLIFPGQAYPLDSQPLVALVYLGVFWPVLTFFLGGRSFHKRSTRIKLFSGKTGVCQNRGWHQLLTFSCPSKPFFQHQMFPKFLCHFVSLFYFLFIPGAAGVAAVFHSIASTQEPLDAENHFCNFILIGICAETLHSIHVKTVIHFHLKLFNLIYRICSSPLFTTEKKNSFHFQPTRVFFLFLLDGRDQLKETHKTIIDDTACPCLWVFEILRYTFVQHQIKKNASIIWLQIRVWGL